MAQNLWVKGSPGYEGDYRVNTNNIPTAPNDMMRQAGDLALGIRNARNQELTDLGSEFAGYDQGLAPLLESEYRSMIGGGWDLTPEQESNFLDLEGLETLDAGGRLDAFQQGAGRVRDAATGRLDAFQDAINPRDGTEERVYDWLGRLDTEGFDILRSNNADVRGVLDILNRNVSIADPTIGGGYGGGGGGGWGGGGVSAGGAVSMSPVDLDRLKLSDRFQDFFMTPEEQEAMIRSASRTVGERYRTSRGQGIDALRQAGITNPFAMAELERRFAEDEGRAADAAIMDARVTGDRERAGRLLAGEQIETDLNKTRAGLETDISRTNAQLKDSAAGRSLQASLANQAEAAAAARLSAQIQAANRQLEAQLNSANRQFVAGALEGLGTRETGWLDNVAKTGIGWEQARDNEMNRRNEVLAREGWGGMVDAEGALLQGETGLRSNIADQGLQYSNAKSGRYGQVYDFNRGGRAAGMEGGTEFWGKNRDDRIGTYDLRARNDAFGIGSLGAAGSSLATAKNNERPGFWENLGNSALNLGMKAASGWLGMGG